MIDSVAELHSAGHTRWLPRVGWTAASLAFLVFAVVALATMQTGLHGDLRTADATPHAGQSATSFLGITDWPLISSIAAGLVTVCFFGLTIWRSLRDRRPHWALMVGIAALFAGALDPLANWATFTVFDPRVAHFPLSWHYFRASPLLEPTLSFLGGYASYYVLTGLGLLAIHRRLVEPWISGEHWLGQHRSVAVFVTAFTAGLPLNALIQLFWLKVGLFVYTEAAGPLLHLAGRQLPLLMVVYDSVLFAVLAVLCVPDDEGRPAVIAGLAQRLPVIRAGHLRCTAGQLLVSTMAVLLSAVLLPIVFFSMLRLSGHTAPAYNQWPYSGAKVYDPYGDLQRAGKTGPFYR